jgi:hypothetical protein
MTKKDQTELQLALEAVLYKLTNGGIHGNPYCNPEVKNGLKLLTRLKGRKEWLDVPLTPLNSEEAKS